ncbi:hypothetical protein Taro_044948 [Colocasia esculenta]|uniref:Uncharacterized protein n=1 Tax=Colocasia esculenta TaxID=4460 RepID=A0A843WVU6_COLES|nr:hypothetical protein [Colocasia esculenta]
MKEYMAGRQQQRGIRIQQQAELHEELSGKGKSKAVMKGRQVVVDVDESDDTDYEDLSPNEREWREGLRQSRRAAMLERVSAHTASSPYFQTMIDSIGEAGPGYFFNPRHQYSDSPHNDGEVLQGTINVISRLSRSTDEIIDAMMEEQRFAEREALSPPIDVDELLDEEHPLNAWVETRQERDVPEFDPRDCSWAEGELDGVEARDPELRLTSQKRERRTEREEGAAAAACSGAGGDPPRSFGGGGGGQQLRQGEGGQGRGGLGTAQTEVSAQSRVPP